MKKKLLKNLPAIIALFLSLQTGATNRSFAIFVDSISHSKASPELIQYAQAVSRQGLNTEIVVINPDVTPDSIRSIIRSKATRKKSPIEGMVFVGDIPVPMLLDAQHFASAFKAVQNPKRLERSSVPSDRFYDDLDMKFDFISQDPKKPLLYYYSLRSDSPAEIVPELYSGRIKPMALNGKDKYENLRDYLKKVVNVKNRNEQMQQMFLFSGQGYNSESMTARIDEVANAYQQFPWMSHQANSFNFLDHRQANPGKYIIMSTLQRPEISLALLHHHGSTEKEYINRYPDPRNVTTQLEEAKRFFRSKIRSSVESGKSLEEAIDRYANMYDVPASWFKTVLDKESVDADSIYDSKLDLYIDDFANYNPNARIVMLDACFNGSFNNDEYIAGAYIFSKGDCVVAIANSVNSIQDKWSDKNIGLLGEGMRVGNITKYNPILEMHVIGDPTFAFAPKSDLGFDINTMLVEAPVSFWKKQIATSSTPSVKVMALEKLIEAGAYTPSQTLEFFKKSNSAIERYAALMLLSKKPGKEFTKAIELGLNDNNEVVRRFATIFAGKNGSPELIPAIIKAYANPLKGERVNFQLQMAMPLYDYDALIAELDKQRPYRYAYNEQEMMENARKDIESRCSNKKYADDIANLASEKPNVRDARLFIRQLRNNPLHPSLDTLLSYINKCDNEELLVSLVEALGWFNYSYRAPEISNRMVEIANDTNFSEDVRNEAAKTAVRLGKNI
ncbi:MAG: hypothetical protein K2G74_06945 [Muribaculaceae bacterium]|nr:hypothetical protein [Muribaculaceae bacterium]